MILKKQGVPIFALYNCQMMPAFVYIFFCTDEFYNSPLLICCTAELTALAANSI